MDAPEIDLDQEMDFEAFVSQFFPGFELDSVVMPKTGERIEYVDGKEQAKPADASGVQTDGHAVDAPAPGQGDGHQGR
jgi:hypothetical protein